MLKEDTERSRRCRKSYLRRSSPREGEPHTIGRDGFASTEDGNASQATSVRRGRQSDRSQAGLPRDPRGRRKSENARGVDRIAPACGLPERSDAGPVLEKEIQRAGKRDSVRG